MVSLKRGTGKRCVEVAKEDAFQVQALSSICRVLKQSSLLIDGKHMLTETILAQLIHGLRKHYETNYGKDSPKPRPITIPAYKLFTDYAVNGSLHVILSSLLEGATVRDLLPFDKLFEHDAKTLLPLLHDIDKNLHANGLFFAPAVFLNKVPVSQLNKLSKITIEHGGKIVTSEDKATHIIDWNEDVDGSNADADDNARLTAFQRNHENAHESVVQAHWVFTPDSYDEFLPVTAVTTLSDPNEIQSLISNYALRQRYYVSCRYILDCDVFNEWGNEGDYENVLVEEDDNAGATDGNAGKRGKKSKRNSSVGGVAGGTGRREAFIPQALNNPFSLFASDKLFFPDVLPASISDPSAKQQVLDLSHIQPTLSTTESKEDSSSSTVLGKRNAANISTSSPAEMPEKSDTTWFSMDSISDVERRYVPYLLAEPSVYMTMRNAMITIYNQNPHQYLSCTECRRKLADDVSKVVRMHEFLDAFGLINHKVKYESRPQNCGQLLDEMSCTIRRQKVLERLQAFHLPSLALQHSTSSSTAPTNKWTVEMDSVFRSLIENKQRDWKAIAHEMEAKYQVNFMQCMNRFLEISFQNQPAVLSDALESGGASSSTEVPAKGVHINKQQDLIKFKQAMQLISSLEKLIIQLKLEQSKSKNGVTSNTSSDTAGNEVEMTTDVDESANNADSSSKDSAEHIQQSIEAYEQMVLHLREQILQAAQQHMQLIGERVENMLKDYVDERFNIINSKLKIFSHVEDVLNLEREKIDIEKHELLLQRIPQSSLPSYVTGSANSSNTYITLSSSYANLSGLR